jgi:peptide/nickel transport system permease protein
VTAAQVLPAGGGGRALPAVLASIRRTPAATIVAAVGAVLLVVAALGAPWLAPYPPLDGQLLDRLLPPAWAAGGTADHLLGTDTQGRDVLSRLLYGARTTLSVAVLGVLVPGVIGTALGLLAGYRKGVLGAAIARTAEVSLAIPAIQIAALLAAVFRPSFTNVLVVTAVSLWPYYARVVRAETLACAERDFVKLAVVAGCRDRTIVTRHILPNVLPSVFVLVSLHIGVAILIESGLSFVGMGIPIPNPSWGSMVNEGARYIDLAWWLSVLPGAVIIASVLALNVLADRVRDLADPRAAR